MLTTGRSFEDCVGCRANFEAELREERHRRQVARVGHGFEPLEPRVVEQRIDQTSYRLARQTSTLMSRCEGEPQLGRTAVIASEQPNIPDQSITRFERDGDLLPLSWSAK